MSEPVDPAEAPGEGHPMEGDSRMKGTPREPLSEDLTFDGRPRCTATSRQSGVRCKRAATPGTNVCANHGSKAPQTRRKAMLRLASLADPAIATLAREMARADSSADRQRAANSILDRAGFGRATKIETDDARQILVDRLLALRDSDDDDEGGTDE